MHAGRDHITVCVCTFKRPHLLKRLLDHLAQLETGDRFTYSIVVADNDSECSAERIANDVGAAGLLAVTYRCEPRQNIAHARNLSVAKAEGDFIAFIDDDEFPERDWLDIMHRACTAHSVAGVLGPVRPYFDNSPPQWIIDGGFCDRPEHTTGHVMPWEECRTGNVLFRRSIIDGLEEPFDPKFGTGAEDKDFFMRMHRAGHTFIWCNEGVVYEEVPADRQTRSYMLRRALLRGRNNLKISVGRSKLILRSLIAVPAYLALLPFTLPFGQHRTMKYMIKLCDHAGRLLAVLGLNPVKER